MKTTDDDDDDDDAAAAAADVDDVNYIWFQLTSDVDGGGLCVTADTVDALTLVLADVRHLDVTDDQFRTARDDVTNPDSSTLLTSHTD